jgi:hypothetical protein
MQEQYGEVIQHSMKEKKLVLVKGWSHILWAYQEAKSELIFWNVQMKIFNF